MKRFISWILSLLMLSSPAEISCGAWLPDWDSAAAVKESSQLTCLDSVTAFAAYLRPDGSIYLPWETEQMLQELQKNFAGSDTAVRLSVVNDVVYPDGHTDSKSREILLSIFSDSAMRQKHMDALTELVSTCDLAALELDYENLGKDTDLWAQYVAFLQELNGLLEPLGTKLRVCLQWDAADYAALPENIDYTVMCYNLYGYHSGPGPKADTIFLKKAAANYRGMGDRVAMALATGGFLWENGSVSAAVTQKDAEALVKKAGVRCARDSASGALHAKWQQDGNETELWYADGETLTLWRNTLMDLGFARFDLFRLGGNDIAQLKTTFFAR